MDMEQTAVFLFLVTAMLLTGRGIYRAAVWLTARHMALIGEAYAPGHERFIRRRIVYPVAGALFLFCYQQIDRSEALWVSWILLSFLLLIALIDLEYQYIFDEVLMVLSMLGLLLSPWLSVSLLDRLGGGMAGFGIMLLLALPVRGAIGGGDIKLMAALGLWLGLDGIWPTLFIGILSGGIVALLLLCCGRKKRTDFIAYGPYLTLGAAIYWLTEISGSL